LALKLKFVESENKQLASELEHTISATYETDKDIYSVLRHRDTVDRIIQQLPAGGGFAATVGDGQHNQSPGYRIVEAILPTTCGAGMSRGRVN
jgi:hypothetical protein